MRWVVVSLGVVCRGARGKLCNSLSPWHWNVDVITKSHGGIESNLNFELVLCNMTVLKIINGFHFLQCLLFRTLNF